MKRILILYYYYYYYFGKKKIDGESSATAILRRAAASSERVAAAAASSIAISDLKVGKRIGRGSLGSVWRAKLYSRLRVAVKQMDLDDETGALEASLCVQVGALSHLNPHPVEFSFLFFSLVSNVNQ